MKAEMEVKMKFGIGGLDLWGHCRDDHRIWMGWLGNRQH